MFRFKGLARVEIHVIQNDVVVDMFMVYAFSIAPAIAIGVLGDFSPDKPYEVYDFL